MSNGLFGTCHNSTFNLKPPQILVGPLIERTTANPVKIATKSTFHHAYMTKRTHFQKPLLETILEESSATQSQQHKKIRSPDFSGPRRNTKS